MSKEWYSNWECDMETQMMKHIYCPTCHRWQWVRVPENTWINCGYCGNMIRVYCYVKDCVNHSKEEDNECTLDSLDIVDTFYAGAPAMCKDFEEDEDD